MMRIPRGLALLLLGILPTLSFPEVATADPFTSSLRTRIERFVEERAGGTYDSIHVPSLGDFELKGIEPSDIRVELSTRARGRLAGAVPVSVVLSNEDQVLKRGIVTARVNANRTVQVAARALRRGERLAASDLREERIDATSVPSGATRDLAQLVGLEMRRSVREGTPVRMAWVSAPALVERGQLVRIVVVRSGLRIEGQGRAVSNGALGERIRVVNTDSRREVVGRVARDGSVHVGL